MLAKKSKGDPPPVHAVTVFKPEYLKLTPGGRLKAQLKEHLGRQQNITLNQLVVLKSSSLFSSRYSAVPHSAPAQDSRRAQAAVTRSCVQRLHILRQDKASRSFEGKWNKVGGDGALGCVGFRFSRATAGAPIPLHPRRLPEAGSRQIGGERAPNEG